MALPDFNTQDPATYKAAIDATADDHENRISANESAINAMSFSGCLLENNASPLVADSTYVIPTLDTTLYDTDGFLSGGKIVIPPGLSIKKVRLTAYVSFFYGNSSHFQINSLLNSSAIFEGQVRAESSWAALTFSTPVFSVSDSDSIEVNVWQNTGASRNIAVYKVGLHVVEK